MKDRINNHLDVHNLINKSQHGFMKGKSCLTNLLEFLEDVTTEIDSGKPVDAIYLDFSKAFDKVPKHRLIAKVRAHGISGNVLSWIENWLTDRKQRVVIKGSRSSWSIVLSGVPQGSVLGPLLFILYINDIDLNVASRSLQMTVKSNGRFQVRPISSCYRTILITYVNGLKIGRCYSMLANVVLFILVMAILRRNIS